MPFNGLVAATESDRTPWWIFDLWMHALYWDGLTCAKLHLKAGIVTVPGFKRKLMIQAFEEIWQYIITWDRGAVMGKLIQGWLWDMRWSDGTGVTVNVSSHFIWGELVRFKSGVDGRGLFKYGLFYLVSIFGSLISSPQVNLRDALLELKLSRFTVLCLIWCMWNVLWPHSMDHVWIELLSTLTSTFSCRGSFDTQGWRIRIQTWWTDESQNCCRNSMHPTKWNWMEVWSEHHVWI